MRIEQLIQNVFGKTVFERPVFYQNPGGLRFELSEGEDWLEIFSSARKKALEICNVVFGNEFLLCVRIYGGLNLVPVLSVIKDLKRIGLYPDSYKEHWRQRDHEEPLWEAEEIGYWHTISFRVSKKELDKILWCCFSRDLAIKPCPQADLFLISIEAGICVWPYDDRGMDVVGPNHKLLSSLFTKFNHYLFDYDLEAMNATFKNGL